MASSAPPAFWKTASRLPELAGGVRQDWMLWNVSDSDALSCLGRAQRNPDCEKLLCTETDNDIPEVVKPLEAGEGRLLCQAMHVDRVLYVLFLLEA